MRYNIFYQIHKALRAMMYETAAELQRTDFDNQEQTEKALVNVVTVVDLFDKHAYVEDTLIFSAVQQYEPSIVDAFEQEHVKDHELSGKLRTLITIFESSERNEEKILLGSAIRKVFVEFLVFNLEHMAKEENVINNLLWRYYADGEIHALEQKIISGQTLETAALVWKWMLRGLSNQEIINWLKTVEKNAPESVFNNLFAMSERELSDLRFRQVLEGLTEGAMLA
ncbi:MAG TPA: hemerythrin domain-containing protein [Chitinophagaceae bacterium]|jgi:hemerythrin-like domain-containing protein|nr:hemerythrin domain-containing protein [Chitinophagaceae bacterium]